MVRLLAAVCVALAFTGVAVAHDYWLQPATFTPAPGREVAVALHVGDGFKSESERPWQPKMATKLELVTAGGKTDLHRNGGEGDKPVVKLTIPKSGTAVLRLDRDWSYIELAADKFNAYLKEEGLVTIRKAREDAKEDEQPGREKYSRYLKAILQAGDARDDTPTKPLGQTLEIVPETNPYRLKAGDSLTVRVLFRDKPLVGAQIIYYHRFGDTVVTSQGATTAEGKLTFKVAGGTWLVRLVHMQRCKDDPKADWESYWAALTFALDGEQPGLPVAEGYRGIWYMNQPTKDEFGYKYSGGMATYPQQHVPIAFYSKEADRTFFVYGGTTLPGNAPGKPQLLHMVAYFDHKTKTVSRPRLLLNKKTDDAHDNPTLQIDDAGHLWVFSSAHGTGRPSFIHRSLKPHSIDAFEKTWETNFSYTQPWHVPGKGFLFLHTRYKDGRGLFSMTSADGRKWSEPQPLAKIEMGDYQVSWRQGNRVATAFDYHPKPVGLNARTNLYYLETDDFGATWKTADGTAAKLPLTEVKNPALVRDFQAEGKLVYLKDVNFDRDGRPVILFLTSKGHEPGPKGGTREWHTARWTGTQWEFRPLTTSDHNYDHGSLYVEGDVWRVIAPTDAGPQPHGTGGEMVMWESKDRGQTWAKVKALTAGSPRNHTYARRPVNAHPDFYAIWADGNPLKPSESHLYFCTRDGAVFRLPPTMTADAAKPEPVPVK